MQSFTSISEALDEFIPEPGLVVLMCGVAGSGKTTFSQRLEARGFIRISIDEFVWNAAGRYGLDYSPEAYGGKVSAAREELKIELAKLLSEGRPVVVDSAFWSWANRSTSKPEHLRHPVKSRCSSPHPQRRR